MAYTKTQWVNNEEPSINAENLNKMEQGIADAQSTAQWGSITGQLSNQTDLNNALTELNGNLSQKVSSVNGETPDTNGNVQIDATNIDTSSGVAIKSVSGNPITIADALQGKALGVNTTLEPIQSGSGDPSPTNIRPISGRTQVEISNKDSEDVEQASVTVDLGQTVYGGTLNVSTGELVVTHRYTALTGTESWTSYGNETVYVANILVGSYPSDVIRGICSHAPNSGVNIDGSWMRHSNTGRGVQFDNLISKWGLADNARATVNAYLADQAAKGTPVEIVDVLATPLTIQLTHAQVYLLTGTNIISTNADNLSVRYYATGQTGNVEGNIAFLSEKTVSNENAISTVSESIAHAETGTATQNYVAGSYLMLNNRLCKVTAAIATGEQIIVGSNVRYTTVAEELVAILAQINA